VICEESNTSSVSGSLEAGLNYSKKGKVPSNLFSRGVNITVGQGIRAPD
jgi:hypothetical protein